MFSFNVLPKGHLQKSKAHVQSLYDVRLAGQWMLAPGTLPARHLSLDCLEPLQHLVLETLKGAVQDVGTNLLKPLARLEYDDDMHNVMVFRELENTH